MSKAKKQSLRNEGHTLNLHRSDKHYILNLLLPFLNGTADT